MTEVKYTGNIRSSRGSLYALKHLSLLIKSDPRKTIEDIGHGETNASMSDTVVSVRQNISPRQSLSSSQFSNFPFQLIPGGTHACQLLEKNLVWQSEQSQSNSSIPETEVILTITDFAEFKILVDSLKVQSNRKFSLSVLVQEAFSEDQEKVRELEKNLDDSGFNYLVFQREQDSCLTCAYREIVGASCADWVLISPDQGFFHPEALFALAREAVNLSAASGLIFNELQLSSTRKLSHYLRKPVPNRFGILSRNWLDGGVFISRKSLLRVLSDLIYIEEGHKLKTSSELLWAVGLLFADHLKLLPLALINRIEKGKTISQDTSARLLSLIKALDILPVEDLKLSNRGDSFDPVALFVSGKIQVVIPFQDKAELTILALQSLEKQDCLEDLEIVLVDNRSVEEERLAIENYLENSKFVGNYQLLLDGGHFNFARLNNSATELSDSPYILFMNNDVVLSDSNTLSKLRSFSAWPQVGVVGGELSYPNGGVQSAGISFAAVRPMNVRGENLFSNDFRKVDSLSFALAMIKRDVWEAVGGLDELRCPNGFGDALIGKKLSDAGFASIFSPNVRATHHESPSRGRSVEDLELYDLSLLGVGVAQLHEQFQVENQPQLISIGANDGFGSNLPNLEVVVEKIKQRPNLAANVEVAAEKFVSWGKKIKDISQRK